jgi:tetratricopeptide (TPR) repeat protein
MTDTARRSGRGVDGGALRVSSIWSSRRRGVAAVWPTLRRLGLVVACGLAVSALAAFDALAGEAVVRGAEMNRYGRVSLTFDKANKVNARVANGILIVSFAHPTTIKDERLPLEMPSYVATVRQDPDGSGLRLALTGPYRVNVLEAAEKVFVDLLPETWTGLPPGLPPDVVAELARRAQEAEALVQAEGLRRQVEGLKALKARVASLPSLTRIVFEPPGTVPVKLVTKGSETVLVFEAPLAFEPSQVAGRLAPAVRSFKAEGAADSLVIRLTVDAGYTVRGFREDETYVLDVAKPQPSPGTVAVGPDQPNAPDSKPAVTEKPAPADPQASPKPAAAAPPARDKPATPIASGPVQAKATMSADGLRVVFPFQGRAAAAGFERSGLLTLVFHTAEPLAPFDLPAEAKSLAKVREIVRQGAATIVRLDLAKPQVARLAPEDQSWVLTVGDGSQTSSRPLAIRRSTDDANRAVILVPLAETSGVHWIDDPQGGERIAVVTAYGAPSGIPKPQRLVEFALLPTFHGVAVSAFADDVTVRPSVEGVTISRAAGLSVSLLAPNGERQGERTTASMADYVIQRDPWLTRQLGDVQERYRELLHAAGNAPRSGRAAARMDLAHFLLANQLNHEADSVLAHAVQEDPYLQHQRRFNLLQGVALLRMGRLPEARKALSATALADDPEGILWRASLDALQKRWAPAHVGFRDSAAVLESYPEDLQASLRMQGARAAMEMRNFTHAGNELTAISSLLSPRQYEDMSLLRARLDELGGRPEMALDTYRELMEKAERPAAARATLAWIELGLQHGVVEPAAAIPQLETLAVAWRGDEVEAGALARLGRLYAESGRWREAFTITRRVNQIFPDHAATRDLHDYTARLFEDLFLTGKGDSLSRVDSLALYFDFKEFTPIGPRGDEIVRRLADRLVELDLIDQASALLQYQVDNRLTGAARATVAARLATLRLMDGKPAQALEALRATRLPELPKTINRARLLLEARALSDLTRTDLALELLGGETGAEIDRLRADILWSGGRWREAGESHEKLVGSRWQGSDALTDQDRNDLMRAAVAYSLGDDPLALDRLRAKFAGKMADSADARTFAFVTQPNVASTRAFRELARRVTSADTLADFLSEYRKRYPDAATPGRPRTPGLQRPEERPQAQAAEPATPPNG